MIVRIRNEGYAKIFAVVLISLMFIFILHIGDVHMQFSVDIAIPLEMSEQNQFMTVCFIIFK